jgi:hypothetical protein
MPTIEKYLENVDFHSQQFIGTVAFRSEDIQLPDGSKMALGIDDGHWVLVYQKSSHGHFKVFNYDHHEKKIFVDQKAGGSQDLKALKKHLHYFFSHTKVADLVTLLPPKAAK